jgi:hypothetical protein
MPRLVSGVPWGERGPSKGRGGTSDTRDWMNRRSGGRLWGLDRSPSPGRGQSGEQSGPTGYGKGRQADDGDIRSPFLMLDLWALGHENPVAEGGIPVYPPRAVC